MFRWIIIFILLTLLYLIGGSKSNYKTVTKVDTIVTTKTIVNYKKGNDIKQILLDTIYNTDYDTITIIKDYQQVKEYTDSIRQDSNLYVIRDTISQNRIIGRSFKTESKEKTIVITKTEIEASLYLGLRSDVRRDINKLDHNITLNLKTRQRGLFSIGAGTSGVSLGYAIKL